MSNQAITYLVGVCAVVFGLTVFGALVVAPAVSAYRRPLHRVAALILSLYVLAAMIGIGVAIGAVLVIEWPRIF